MVGQEWKTVNGRWEKKEGQANGMKYFYIENEESAWKSKRKKKQTNDVPLKD